MEFAVNGTGHANVCALAGTGKTFTLLEVVKAVLEARPSDEIFLGAYNKAIATELQAKLVAAGVEPKQASASTLTLSTVHKSKGREWDRVYILGRNRVGIAARTQLTICRGYSFKTGVGVHRSLGCTNCRQSEYTTPEEKFMISISTPLATVWEAEGYSEVTGVRSFIGYFTEQADAAKAGKGQGAWGSNAAVKQVSAPSIVIYETFEEFIAQGQESLRASALKKLTEEERCALGLAGDHPADEPRLLAPLTYTNNWETHEYYVLNTRLSDDVLRTIERLYIDRVGYEARTRRVTEFRALKLGSAATSLLLEVLVKSNAGPEAWYPVQQFLGSGRQVEVDAKWREK